MHFKLESTKQSLTQASVFGGQQDRFRSEGLLITLKNLTQRSDDGSIAMLSYPDWHQRRFLFESLIIFDNPIM